MSSSVRLRPTTPAQARNSSRVMCDLVLTYAAFAKAGRKRATDFQIIVTPPLAMTADAVPAYADLGVDRLLVNLGSQRPERVDTRLGEIETMVRKAA